MQKTFASFLVILGAALPAFAASTCEYRVDNHQDATTRQRVAYCLTPEPERELPPGPALVYYSISSNEPQTEPEEKAAKQKTVYFDKDQVAVNQYFTDTKNFPAFENDTLSEQERATLQELARQDAAQAAAVRRQQLQAAAQQRAQVASARRAQEQAQAASKPAVVKSAATNQSASEKIELGAPSVLSEEDEAGLLARKDKPKRFMKAVPEVASAYSINEYGTAVPGGYAPAQQPAYAPAYADPAAGMSPDMQANPYAAPMDGMQQPYQPAALPSQPEPGYSDPAAYVPENTANVQPL